MIARRRLPATATHVPELLVPSAFLAGLLGSAHCLGMCGGIAGALSASARGALSVRSAALLQNLGRVGTYSLVGAAAGAAGAAAGLMLGRPAAGQYLRLGASIAMLLLGLRVLCGAPRRLRWLRAAEHAGAILWRRLQPLATTRLPRSGAARALAMGMLWGWLPCGLVYSVLAAASMAGGALHGAATMAAFGLGTLPAVSGWTYLAGRLMRPRSPSRLLGVAVMACGVWSAVLPVSMLLGTPPHCEPVPPQRAADPSQASAGRTPLPLP